MLSWLSFTVQYYTTKLCQFLSKSYYLLIVAKFTAKRILILWKGFWLVISTSISIKHRFMWFFHMTFRYTIYVSRLCQILSNFSSLSRNYRNFRPKILISTGKFLDLCYHFGTLKCTMYVEVYIKDEEILQNSNCFLVTGYATVNCMCQDKQHSLS